VAIAARLEQAYGPATREHVAELATHFLHGRDEPKAVRYLQLAAEQALRRSAYREVVQHLSVLLQVLERLPEGAERDRAELLARMSLAPALIATRGFAAPEVEQTYSRAQELCRRLDDPPELSLVLHGLAAVNEFRGRYPASERLLKQVLQHGDPALAGEVYELLACSTLHQGAFRQALEHAEAGLSRYDPENDSIHLAPYGEHPTVACHDWAALALWFLGRPDSALAHAEQALALAHKHSYSLTTAQLQLAFLHQHRDEPQQTLRWAEETIAVGTEHGFPLRVAQATILRGWGLARLGAGVDAVGELRRGLSAYLATGAEMEHPYYLGLLGDTLSRSGRPDEGLAVVDEALGMVQASRSFFYQAELHRLRGDLLLDGDGQAELAAGAYHRAFDISTRQGARSLALRAAIRLCRLPDPSERQVALARLRDAYDGFQEGFDTPDLLAARALLS
jgi:tetratricopeptide (TPR) repeat protein